MVSVNNNDKECSPEFNFGLLFFKYMTEDLEIKYHFT